MNDERPLSFACSFGRVEIATALLDAGVDIDACDKDGLSALHWAVKNGESGTAPMEGQIRVVGLLLGRGANTGLRTKVRLRGTTLILFLSLPLCRMARRRLTWRRMRR